MSKLNTSDSKIYISGKTIFISVSLLIILLVNTEFVRGQVYPNRNFTVNEGLINSSVYAIAQDSAGFMWFGTENGLSRFDGVDFKNYSLKNLGVNYHIVSLKIINKDSMIIGCGINGLYIFELLTGRATRIDKDTVSQSNDIIIADSVLIALHEYHNIEIVSLATGKKLEQDIMITTDPENKSNAMVKLSDGRILLVRINGLYEIVNRKQIKIDIPMLNDLPMYSIWESTNKDLFIGTKGAIYQVSNNAVVNVFEVENRDEDRVRNLLVDNQNNIWYSLLGGSDIHVINGKNDVNVSKIVGIRNTFITKIFLDRDGNVWVGTVGKGVYLFSNLHIRIYPESDDFPNPNVRKIIKTSKGGILVGTVDGLAHINSENNQIKSFKPFSGITHYVRDFVKINESEFAVAVTDQRLNEKKFKEYHIPDENILIHFLQGSSLLKDSTQLLVGSWDNCYYSYSLPGFKFLSEEAGLFRNEVNQMRINTMFRDEYDRLWIGGQLGFFVMDYNKKKVFINEDIQADNIIKILSIGGHKVAVVSNNGFVVFENNVNIDSITKIRKIKVPSTTSIAFADSSEYVIGTLNGLIYHFEGKEKLITVNDGILFNSINEIYHPAGTREVWIGTTEGLLKTNLDDLKISLNSEIKISYVVIEHEDKSYKYENKPLEFEYSQSAFTFHFNAFQYQNPRAIKYQYRVNNSDWTFSTSGDLQFTSMEPGSHNIQLKVSYDGLNTAGPVTNIVILILPPFYMTWWFYLISGVVGVVILYLLFRLQMKKIKSKQDEKNLIKQKIVELQQKALASSLNPHFVFNSLNSIQHFINANKQEDANNYLAKFSRLMRLHLNMADKSFISIKEEVERLEFYLNLEQMRFGKKMNWSITVDEKIDIFKTHIPNMTIQPFVENAIWHGIMPMVGDGIVTVEVKMAGVSDLIITISDNGVGYGYAKHTNGSAHESKGIKLITERLSLLDPDATNLISFRETIPGLEVTIKLTTLMYHTGNTQLDYQGN